MGVFSRFMAAEDVECADNQEAFQKAQAQQPVDGRDVEVRERGHLSRA
jgi:hypothetical protein